jgi:hypothetical protein
MGKLITPLIIAFFVGLSGGGFFTVWRTTQAHDAAVVAVKQGKPLPTHGDSTTADSTAADSSDSASHDTPGHTPAPADSAQPAAPAHATPTGGESHAATGADAHTPAAAAAPTADSSARPRALGQEARLAKLFGAMAPKDAARVLTQMDNRDVQTILNLVGDKQAAAILTLLPADRAVAFSQNQLRRQGGE